MFIVSVKLACKNCDAVVCPRTPLRAGPFIRPMHREAEKQRVYLDQEEDAKVNLNSMSTYNFEISKSYKFLVTYEVLILSMHDTAVQHSVGIWPSAKPN